MPPKTLKFLFYLGYLFLLKTCLTVRCTQQILFKRTELQCSPGWRSCREREREDTGVERRLLSVSGFCRRTRAASETLRLPVLCC